MAEVETRLLLDEGITPAGKPLLHRLTVQDHYTALLFIIKKAKEKIVIAPQFIQEINAAVMKQTGSVIKQFLVSWMQLLDHGLRKFIL